MNIWKVFWKIMMKINKQHQKQQFTTPKKANNIHYF